MQKLRVGVLRGGPSPEYEVSLKSGENVLAHLPKHYSGVDVLITKDGTWHIGGIPLLPEHVARKVDVFLNALHGAYGEDGKVQGILDSFGVPYTGSRALPSAISMAKHLGKRYYRGNGLLTPMEKLVRNIGNIEGVAKEIVKNIPGPWVVKPAGAGSSIVVTLAKNYEELMEGIMQAFLYSDSALVEEYIAGTEATCVVVASRGGAYALPPIEIRKGSGGIFNYTIKYDGSAEEVCPGNFTEAESRKIMYTSVRAHKVLGLSHYSRSDMIVSPRGVYILETNSLPGLTRESLIMKLLKTVGTRFSEFLDHIIQLAYGGR